MALLFPSVLAGCYANLTETATAAAVTYDEDDTEAATTDSAAGSIVLSGTSISFTGSGATVSGTVITITAAGTYSVSGTLDDGRIVVNSADSENVKLVLGGASISCSTGSPVEVLAAEKVVVTLAEGTVNSVADGASYSSTDGSNAAIYATSDLTFNGSGSLAVDANYATGIRSKDGLKITGGVITVDSVGDGIKGRDYIAMKDGTVTVNAVGDGLQAYNDEDSSLGTIQIDGGTLTVVAGSDGIQAEASAAVSAGTVTISSGGGSTAASVGSTYDSFKGLKAVTGIAISGGAFTISSYEDAIHCDAGIAISGGTFSLAARATSTGGGQGIKFGDSASMTVAAADIDISSSYEGISGYNLTINGGSINMTAVNDGFNMTAGTVEGGSETDDGSKLCINGGTIAVYVTAGDGVDVNGSASMTGGTLIVHDAYNTIENAVDTNGGFSITGGLLVASAGYSSGMTKNLTSSSQYSVLTVLSSAQNAGVLFHIQDSGGTDLCTFNPAYKYQCVIFSSPGIVKGTAYTVYYGGSDDGTATDGLYSDGTYTAGTSYKTFTPSSTYAITVGSTSRTTGPGR